MDLALPALTIFALALPGFVLRQAYLRGMRNLPLTPTSFVEEIAWGLALACGMHCMGVSVVCRTTALEPDYEALLRLLSGSFGEDGQHVPAVADALFAHSEAIGGYLGCQLTLAFVAGTVTHKLVERLPSLRNLWLFKFRDDWHLLLTKGQAKGPDGSSYEDCYAEVTAVVCMQEADYLYRGLLLGPDDMHFDAKGDLERLVLVGVDRRRLAGPKDTFEEIPGDRFVMRYADTRTLNLNFYAWVDAATSNPLGQDGSPLPPGGSTAPP